MQGPGQHFMLDLYGCEPSKLTDAACIFDFLNNFPKKINMAKTSDPSVFKYEGAVSGVVLIKESHISIHTFPEKGQAFVDIFSCNDIDQDAARQELMEFFKASHYEEEFESPKPIIHSDIKSLAGFLHV